MLRIVEAKKEDRDIMMNLLEILRGGNHWKDGNYPSASG